MSEEAKTKEIEIWVYIDEDGDYGIGVDCESAAEYYNDSYGIEGPKHEIKLTLTVPLPKTIEVSGFLPASESGEYRLEIKEQS